MDTSGSDLVGGDKGHQQGGVHNGGVLLIGVVDDGTQQWCTSCQCCGQRHPTTVFFLVGVVDNNPNDGVAGTRRGWPQ